MKFKKTISFGALFFGVACLSSCSFFPGAQRNIILDNGANINLSVADTVSVSDNVIKPSDYEMTNTMSFYKTNSIYKNVKYVPSTGDSKILVLPIDLSGLKYSTAHLKPISTSFAATSENKEKINEAFFGSSSTLSYESVNTFYKKSSYNKLNLTGDVASWYDVTKSGYKYLGDIKSESDVIQIMNDAVTYLDIDTSLYDSDKDGYIDGVWLIYNYYDYITAKKQGSNISSNYWAYTYWDQSSKTPSTTNPVTNCFAWASYDFMDKSEVNLIDSHTYIHETGHMLGLNDYYDYNSNYSPLGGVDMMDANIIDHNYYSKMLLGWVKPYIVSGDCDITLSTKNDENNFIIVPYNGLSLITKNGKKYFNPFDEYILIEYYTPTGLNKNDSDKKYENGYKAQTNSGFRVYHIDARLVSIKYYNGTYVGSYYDGEDLSVNESLTKFSTNTGEGSNGENEEVIYANLRNKGVIFSSSFHYSSLYHEIMLIDKSGNYSSYSKPFYSTITKKIVSCDNNSLFYSGDVFSLSTYSSSFISKKFNNGKTFDSNVKFK